MATERELWEERLENNLEELECYFNSKYVTITHLQERDGEMKLLRVDAKVPCYIIKQGSSHPVYANGISFLVSVPSGFPNVKPRVYYGNKQRLASVNVFRSGEQCTDKWKVKNSSLRSIVEKTLRDIVHDTSVTNYKSMADKTLESWQRAMENSRKLPTMNPALLFAQNNILSTPKEATSSAPPMPCMRISAPPMPRMHM